ncbi:MAG: hypothetical protein GXO63_03100 [Candidatus Micrarchaeota archaeon]|nr:hypothetical protein [Candidatus Micrarchaeota archaeon]
MKPEEVRYIVYFLILVWVIHVVSLLTAFQILGSDILRAAPLLLVTITVPLVATGLWKLKKWGLYSGFGLSAVLLADSLLYLNVIGAVVWGAVLYYLYKARNFFS